MPTYATEESAEEYKSRMKRLLWTVVPETYLSKRYDGTPNPEYNRFDPRVSGQDARRMVTISQRLTDCELSRAPPQHVPGIGEVTKRLGMLHGYAVIGPAKEEKRPKKTKPQKASKNGNPWQKEGNSESEDDEEDNPMVAKVGERGLTLERRRRERWLRIQREKRDEMIRAEEEAKKIPKRGLLYAPISSKVMRDHQKLKAHNAKLELKKQEEEADRKRLLAFAPPSSYLSTRYGHSHYTGPVRRKIERDGSDGSSTEEDDEAELQPVENKFPPRPSSPTVTTQDTVHAVGTPLRKEKKDRKLSLTTDHTPIVFGVLQPPQGTAIANVGGSQLQGSGRPRFMSAGERKERKQKADIESDADTVFRMANGKYPLLFRQSRQGILSDAELQRLRDEAGAIPPVRESLATEPPSQPTSGTADDVTNRPLIQNLATSFNKPEEDDEKGFSLSLRRKSLLMLQRRPSNLSVVQQGMLSTTQMLGSPQSANASMTFSRVGHATSPLLPNDNPYGLQYDPLFATHQSKNKRHVQRRSNSLTASGDSARLLYEPTQAIHSIEGDRPGSPYRRPPAPATMDQSYIIEIGAEREDLGEMMRVRERRKKERKKREIEDKGSLSFLSGTDGEETGSGGSESGDGETSKNTSPARKMWRAPKKSRWMKEFDTALMVSEALHFVEDSRSKPSMARCSPSETASRIGELSARAVIPSPLRLSVPVKRAQETREKLELAHMAPVIGAGGKDAILEASALRSPQHSKDEAMALLASRPQPTKAREPPAGPALEMSVLVSSPSNPSEQTCVDLAKWGSSKAKSPSRRRSPLGGRLSPMIV